VTFLSGELFERSYEAPSGIVEVLAEIVLEGRRLELRDIAIYPRGPARIDVPVDALMAWVRKLVDDGPGGWLRRASDYRNAPVGCTARP
jgi:hypothetical protein